MALQATRHVRPIPLPHRTDLTALDLSHLKRVAYHAIRLIQNWSSERPRLTEPIETVPFTDDTEIVCIVPGANIIMLFESPHLVLYDSNVRQRVVELPIGSNYWLVSRAYFEIYGKLLMTVAVGDHG